MNTDTPIKALRHGPVLDCVSSPMPAIGRFNSQPPTNFHCPITDIGFVIYRGWLI